MKLRSKLQAIIYAIEPITFLVINMKRLVHASHRKKLRNIILSISQKTGKTKMSIRWDLFFKCFCACAVYSEYESMRLYERPLREMKLIFTHGRSQRVMKFMKTPETKRIFAHKPTFNSVFSKFVKRDWLFLTEKTTLEEFDIFVKKHPVFVAKPPQANKGSGVWLVNSAKYSSIEFLYQLLIKYGTTLVEERINNHKDLDKFSSTSLNTLRIITLLLPDGIKIIQAHLKFNLSGGIADNHLTKGFMCPIKFDTGEIDGNIDALDENDESGEFHPSGFRVIGQKIPYWEEVVSLAKECTLFLDDVYLGAWDIAVTDDGPLIIEGNNGPDFNFQTAVHYPINSYMQQARKYVKKCRKLKKKALLKGENSIE